MQVRKGRKWYKVLKRFGNKILIETPKLLGKPTEEWKDIKEYEEIK